MLAVYLLRTDRNNLFHSSGGGQADKSFITLKSSQFQILDPPVTLVVEDNSLPRLTH